MTEFIELDATISLAKWNAAVAAMLADAQKLEGLLKFDATASVKLDVDDAALRAAHGSIADLGSAVDLRLNLDDSELKTVQSKVDDIATADLRLNVADSELTTVQKKVDDLDTTATVKVDAQDNTASTLASIEGRLKSLQSLATIDLILNATDFVKTFESLPVISTLADIDKQTQRVIGKTLRTDLRNAGDVIRSVYNNAWGDTREEVALVVETVAKMRDVNGDVRVSAQELESVVVGTFQAMDVSGEDALVILDAAEKLVGGGLVDSFQEAFDIIAFGSQNGLALSGDYIDSLKEYAQQFRDAGFSAENFFNILATATAVGNFNTDQAADAFKEFFNLVHEEVADFNLTETLTPRVEQLQRLDLMDEASAFAAGDTTGGDFAEAVLARIAEIPDKAQRLLAAKQIFGETMVENVGKAFFENLDLGKEIDWLGAAEKGSSIINDNLSTAITEAWRTSEDAIAQSIDKAFNVSGFLDKVQTAAVTFADAIQAGSTFGEAFDLALTLPEGSFAQFESSVGNFAIGVLQLIAGVQDFLGHDSSGTRGTIARMAETQLAFDLKLADADEIAGVVQTALDRGVTQSGINEAVGASVSDLVEAGNLQEAYALITGLRSETEGLSTEAKLLVDQYGGIEGVLQASTLAISPFTEAQKKAVEEIRAAEGAIAIDTDALTAQVDAAVDETYSTYQQAIESHDWAGAMSAGMALGQSSADTATSLALPGIQDYLGDLKTQEPLTADDLVNLPDMQTTFDTMTSTVEEKTGAVTVSVVGMRDVSAPAFDTVTESVNDLGIAVETDLGTVSVRVGEVRDVTAEMGETVPPAVDKASQSFTGLASALVSVLQNTPGLIEFINAMKTFDEVGTAALDTASGIGGAAEGGGAGSSNAFAHGGVTPHGEWSTVGERGREAVFADERMAVLNNRTTEAFLSGVQTGGGGSVVNNYVTVNNVFNAASQAANMAGLGAINHQLRGFLS